ncbi:hypothetical protein [Paenibacillus faecalis]|uniref:hypothetical protein n=1 Tax=Paenibacillus faecalis TaxID=2079532 RepID=UPI000D0F97A2|nr:hypothetical protein [Paenibacillus faecalis]
MKTSWSSFTGWQMLHFSFSYWAGFINEIWEVHVNITFGVKEEGKEYIWRPRTYKATKAKYVGQAKFVSRYKKIQYEHSYKNKENF